MRAWREEVAEVDSNGTYNVSGDVFPNGIAVQTETHADFFDGIVGGITATAGAAAPPVVPEPSSILMGGIGALIMAGCACWHRHHNLTLIQTDRALE